MASWSLSFIASSLIAIVASWSRRSAAQAFLPFFDRRSQPLDLVGGLAGIFVVALDCAQPFNDVVHGLLLKEVAPPEEVVARTGGACQLGLTGVRA